MTVQTKVSAKGQVVIPKGVRDQLAWPPGTPLDVEVTASGVTFRRAKQAKTEDFDSALARLQAIARYDGPPGYDDDWNAAILRMFEERGREE